VTISRDNDIYIADTARVVGDVTLGRNVNIWYGAVIRGDMGPITIGDDTNIQDNSVIHCDPGKPMTIGKAVSIAHSAIVHGVDVGDETLVGMGAILLRGSRIGKGCLIAAGSVVAPGKRVPDGMLVMGTPAKAVRPLNEKEIRLIRDGVAQYIDLAKRSCRAPDKG